MQQKSRAGIFWQRVVEDSNLVFFSLGFLAWLVSFLADLSGVKTTSWPWIIPTASVPVFFTGGIALYMVKHYRLSSQVVSIKHLPVVFVVGKPREEARKALTSAQESITRLTGFKAFKQLEDIFNVQYEHLMPHRREWLGHESIQWKDFIVDAERDVHRFCDSIPGEKVYHIFIYGPASLALGLGTAFGTKHQLVVYQSVDGQYKPVINLMKDVRRIKQVVSEPDYKYVRVSYPAQFTHDLAVILEMASHVPRGDVYTYLKTKSMTVEVVEVSNTYGGNLTEEMTGPEPFKRCTPFFA